MRKSQKLAPLHARAVNASASTAAASAQNEKPAAVLPSLAPPSSLGASSAEEVTYECIYREPRNRKLGSSDGRVVLHGGRATLQDDAGEKISLRALQPKELAAVEPGSSLLFGKYEATIGALLSGAQPSATQPLVDASAPPSRTSASNAPPPGRPVPTRPFTKPKGSLHGRATDRPAPAPPGATSSSATAPPAVIEPVVGQLILNVGDEPPAKPVAVERQLSRAMLPWQVEGVRFMYDCTTGRARGASGRPLSGCILAHAPGLGKTLQALSLIFTLLRSGPYGAPVCKKCVVVCPASLCKNWAAEVKRWLPQRLRATLLPPSPQAAAQAVSDFCKCPPQQLLICSYEAVRTHVDALASAPIGLLVCDEGHRLKSSSGNQTVDSLKRLGRARRVILTGTPMQNQLKEFWALADFVCPGELGELSAFNARIAAPVDRGRQGGASPAEREAAEAASERLRMLSEPFFQRRDSSVMRKHLPPRTELALFCHLSAEEAAVYRAVAARAKAELNPLPSIIRLQQICSNGGAVSEGAAPPPSAKLALLMRLLAPVRAAGEQVVLCSTQSRTLDLLEGAITAAGWGALRVDGTTPVGERQPRVDRFNAKEAFAFLLASRAGGAGFNLVGASRLVLVDPDWNPAIDVQAMGRVYRQGQVRPVQIWRLFAAGTIEEKIYMRQLYKQQLEALVEDAPPADAGASAAAPAHDAGGASQTDELKQLFEKDELGGVLDFAESRSGAPPCTTLAALLAGDEARRTAMQDAAAWSGALPDALLRDAVRDDDGLRTALAFACDVRVLEGLRDERAEATKANADSDVGADSEEEQEMSDDEEDEEGEEEEEEEEEGIDSHEKTRTDRLAAGPTKQDAKRKRIIAESSDEDVADD